MAYDIELWESENPENPHKAGESRVAARRFDRLEDGQKVLDVLLAGNEKPLSRVTLSDSRGKKTFWDILRYPVRDTTLDAFERDFSDLRPADAGRASPSLPRTVKRYSQ